MSGLVVLQPIPPSSHAFPVDSFGAAQELAGKLRRSVEGEVRFDRGSRAIYATDASNYRQVPIGIVLPKSKDDVIAAIAACREYGAPVLSRGGGTSLAGQCCNAAVMLDFSKYMDRLIELNADEKYARVEPGIVLDTLRRRAEEHGLTFGPDPATHNHCTLGGMLGNNSCGTHAQMAGKTEDNTLELDIVLYDGTRMTVGETKDDEFDRVINEETRKSEIYSRLRSLRDRYSALIRERYPNIPRRVSGYNLPQLLAESNFNVARALVGTESTCVTILEAKLRLMHNPGCRALVVLGYQDVFLAADNVPEVLKFKPIALEGFDHGLVRHLNLRGVHQDEAGMLPDGKGWLLVEFGADTQKDADAQAQSMLHALDSKQGSSRGKLYSKKADQGRLWELRESALGVTTLAPGKPFAWSGWEDAAVAPDRLGGYLREFSKLITDFGYDTSIFGHFGQGCIHCRINFDLATVEGIQKYRRFIDKAADLVVKHNGSLSGEHGDGQSRAALLTKMFGPELIDAFREFKHIWDPDGKMNPGKIVDPNQPDENLRLGADFNPKLPPTHFKYPEDEGSLLHATMRCVGVGKCRKQEGATMCPSYMVTHEEMHSTRGRAHALFEMLQGEVIDQGWKDDHVKEALDLCLSCKACKHECPVNVDMATYKAEFMSYYYEGRLRPIHAYAYGFIDRWAQLASAAPEAVNLMTHAPGLGSMAKAIAGMPQQRHIPPFSPYTFRHWFESRNRKQSPAHSQKRPKVVLWPDTFNNFFHPQTAEAATRVLEGAGFQVLVPRRHVCCGRPLYDFGFLKAAKRYLQRNLEVIGTSVNSGLPVVVLEPSCASVFRDEMHELMPHDETAKRLRKQTFLLSEFLEECGGDYRPARWNVKAIVHGHCHHKSLMKMVDEESLLKKMGAEVTTLDSGCCGMAGPFGFEKEKYNVSQALAERVLLPAVRSSGAGDVIVTDGFSCREAVSQNSDRKALHLAEVLDLAQRGLGNADLPEDATFTGIKKASRRQRFTLLTVAICTTAATVAAFRLVLRKPCVTISYRGRSL
jgi:FAD/FMN-containing dehydrogenase/Fe-S oxidoreductase